MSEAKVKQLAVKNITADPECQSRRDGLNEPTVKEYVEALKAGAEFPPLVVYHDAAGSNWLSEGFHRFEAYKRHAAKHVSVEMRTGNREDAIRNSLGSNGTHGLKRTNADKRFSVEKSLRLWPDYSDRMIAELACVSNVLVADVRKDFPAENARPATRTGKDGKQRSAAKAGNQLKDSFSSDEPSDDTKATEPTISTPVTSDASAPAPAASPHAEDSDCSGVAGPADGAGIDPFAMPGKAADPEDPPLDPRFMPHAAESVAFAAKFRNWVQRLRAVRTEMRQAMPDRDHRMYKRIDFGQFEATLGESIETLDINVPDHVCPPCCGTGTDDEMKAACKFCDGYGVVDKHHHAGLKARWKRTAKRHAGLVAAAEGGAA